MKNKQLTKILEQRNRAKLFLNVNAIFIHIKRHSLILGSVHLSFVFLEKFDSNSLLCKRNKTFRVMNIRQIIH